MTPRDELIDLKRFIEARIEMVPECGCWIWTGTVSRQGYAVTTRKRKVIRMHRYIYKKMICDIDDTLVLDHLCRVRCCVNPHHLEPVTNRVNILRGIGLTANHAKKTHCPRGHEYDMILKRPNGLVSRWCRTCNNMRNREYRARISSKRNNQHAI